jgi:S1-C subfamily serine protease
LASFLAIDPGGKFLIAGYSDIYEKGHNFIFNPDRIHVVPAYGSVDWLIRYDLDKGAMPQPGAIHSKAGGNGRGVRLSPDGKRVTYLSFVGSPPHSKNLAAWDVNDFDKVPVSYAIKDKASTQEFAYHPHAPWVACLGPSGALLFDRETGDELTTALTDVDFDGAKLHALWFAADGKALVFDTSVNEIHYLHRVPLKLTPDQQRKFGELNKSATTVTPDVETKVPSKEKVALAALHALQGGKGKAMSARDVAKWFTDAVVIVKTPSGNGTGMLVGADGYVLTCAHCIEGDEDIEVSYRRPVENEIKSVTTKAALVNVDEKLDLALLKIKVPFPLRTVRIAASDELASGERVYVIGNPGVRSTILDYTITEGIISSPARKINDLAYVQTSAQVNPGSSGGPMFNENGMVIGQVVLKANIEGAGFATPGDELIAFLVRSADLSSGLGLRREWLDDSGAHSIDATLQEVASDSAKLKKPDGAEVSIPFARLSKPDRVLLDLLKKKLPR